MEVVCCCYSYFYLFYLFLLAQEPSTFISGQTVIVAYRRLTLRLSTVTEYPHLGLIDFLDEGMNLRCVGAWFYVLCSPFVMFYPLT